MPKKLTEYWLLVVEVFSCSKHGPFFSEQEVDDEAKALVRKIMSDSPKRAQTMRLVLMEMSGKGFDITLYTPEFILDLIK